MKYFSLILFLCLLSPIIIKAQTIFYSGTVRDAVTDELLKGATVVIDNNRERTSVITDEAGAFSIIVSQRSHNISVRYLSYVPVSVFQEEFDRDVAFDFKLEKVSNQLEQVVITSKGFDKTIRKPILGVTQINMETMKNYPPLLGR